MASLPHWHIVRQDEDEEEESDALISQVLDEIGISLNEVWFRDLEVFDSLFLATNSRYSSDQAFTLQQFYKLRYVYTSFTDCISPKRENWCAVNCTRSAPGRSTGSRIRGH
jgi:hypothetical protein